MLEILACSADGTRMSVISFILHRTFAVAMVTAFAFSAYTFANVLHIVVRIGHPIAEGAGMLRLVTPLLESLPYSLTGAQMRVIDEIRKDMARPAAMSRIIVGDVGCGKTVCAAAAIYVAVKNGKQAALMVPTEILAIQHYNDLSKLLSPLGINCTLLTSSVKRSEKLKIYASLNTEDESILAEYRG